VVYARSLSDITSEHMFSYNYNISRTTNTYHILCNLFGNVPISTYLDNRTLLSKLNVPH